MDSWYKDRDFPEVKESNADIIAVIENPKQLQRVIDTHNQLLNINYVLRMAVERAAVKIWNVYRDLDSETHKSARETLFKLNEVLRKALEEDGK